jgi:dolichol-phosphate mannosyltransferase
LQSEIPTRASSVDSLAIPADLTVVVPTFNEVGSVRLFVERAERAWQGLNWEIIFVDDNSPDGTAALVRHLARTDPRIRLVQRIGRRGLSSACIEGILASAAPVVAVMDADLQHNETILPAMVTRLYTEDLDVVVATRNVAGASKEALGGARSQLSDAGAWLSRFVLDTPVSDPMSGYFVMTRRSFDEVAQALAGTGFKILVDILASAPRNLRIGEMPYTFGLREHGDSKLDLNAGLEYLYLLVDKKTRGIVPARFVMFGFVGGSGVIVHAFALYLAFQWLALPFFAAQSAATFSAIVSNFLLNNRITFRDARLRGWAALRGFLLFLLICSFGAIANVLIATETFNHGRTLWVAAAAGLIVSSVWNFCVNSILTWRTR